MTRTQPGLRECRDTGENPGRAGLSDRAGREIWAPRRDKRPACDGRVMTDYLRHGLKKTHNDIYISTTCDVTYPVDEIPKYEGRG